MHIRFEEREYRRDPSIRICVNTKEWETISFSDLFWLIESFFVAEDYRHPEEKGGKGRKYPIKAIEDICKGMTIEKVCKKYDVKDRTNIVFADNKSIDIFKKYSNNELIYQTTLGYDGVVPPKARSENAS